MRNAQDNQQKSFGKVFLACLDPTSFDIKEYLTNYLTPNLVIDREGEKKADLPIESLEGNVRKDLAGGKGDRMVVCFTLYYWVIKS